MTTEAAPRRDETVQRQIAQATQRLRRYRLARDRARAARLGQAPYLASLIASILGTPAEALPQN